MDRWKMKPGDRVMFICPDEFMNNPPWKAAHGATGTILTYAAEPNFAVVQWDDPPKDTNWNKIERNIGFEYLRPWIDFKDIHDVERFLNERTDNGSDQQRR